MKTENITNKYLILIVVIIGFSSILFNFYNISFEYPKVKEYYFLFNKSGDYSGFKNLKIEGTIIHSYGNGNMGLVVGVKPTIFDTISKYKYKGSKGYFYDKNNELVWIFQDPLLFRTIPKFKKGKIVIKDFGKVEFIIKKGNDTD